MVDDPGIYQRIIDWVEEVGPKSSEEASKSRVYEKEHPLFSRQARDFRKELLGTLDVSALFNGPAKGRFAGVTIEKSAPEAIEGPAETLALPSPEEITEEKKESTE